MPWTVQDPPAVAREWSPDLKRACVLAANKALAAGHGEEQAVHACIGAARGTASASHDKTSLRAVKDTEAVSLRLAEPIAADRWIASGPQTLIKLGDNLVPSRTFKKDLIRIGTYVKDSAGLLFRVTAESLGINRTTLYKKMKRLGLEDRVPPDRSTIAAN